MRENSDIRIVNFIEEELQKINLSFLKNQSHKLKLLKYLPLIEKLLKIQNKNIKEAYLTEIIIDFYILIDRVSFEGINPGLIERIKSVLKEILNLSLIEKICLEFKRAIDKVEKWSERLNQVLSGKIFNKIDDDIYIPLLENFYQTNNAALGLLERITVRINKHKGEHKFIVVPSEKSLEEILENQIKISWNVSISFAKKFIGKLDDNHEVIIYFDKRAGFCRGNSLGVVLTIKFIEELLKFYKSKILIKSLNSIAITGGIDEKGKILSVGKKVVQIKLELVFYSEIEQFVIPKEDELEANNKLQELKSLYPQRNLKIVPIEDLEDLLNRRNLISIKKQKLFARGKKFLKSNIYAAILTFILLLLFIFIMFFNRDDNPSFVTIDGKKAYIKNKHGRILWTIDYPLQEFFISNKVSILKYFFKVVDINDDNKNEIIYISPLKSFIEDTETIEKIICVDKDNKEVWSYKFTDTVYSEREILPPTYMTRLIDTITFKDRKVIFCFSNNIPSFSSGVYGLDIKTGQRINETLWNSGHIKGAILEDLNRDNISDLIISGLDNGYEDAIIFAVELDKLDGCRLTIQQYLIKDKKVTEPIFYIRIPKIDYENLMGFRFPYVREYDLRLRKDDRKILKGLYSFTSQNLIDENRINTITIEVDSTFKVSEIINNDEFRVFRDNLVARGKLKPPYTDTKEYKELINKNILYFSNGQWKKE